MTVGFFPVIPVVDSLYLFVAELGTEPGENISALLEVSDTLPVPLPLSGALLAGALAAMGAVRALRRRG